MKTMKRIVMVIMVITMMLTLANPAAVNAAQNVKLNKKKVTLTITDKKKNPAVTLKVKNTSKKAKWTTSNKKVATVKKGKVTAKGAGKATITCKVDGKKLTCKVTVKDKRKSRETTSTTETCNHNWKLHWTVFEDEVPSDSFDSSCSCGAFNSKETGETLTDHLSKITLLRLGYTEEQKMLGIHAKNIISKTSTRTDEEGVWHYKIHTEYADYMDCTKCGEHVVTTDLPKK